ARPPRASPRAGLPSSCLSRPGRPRGFLSSCWDLHREAGSSRPQVGPELPVERLHAPETVVELVVVLVAERTDRLPARLASHASVLDVGVLRGPTHAAGHRAWHGLDALGALPRAVDPGVLGRAPLLRAHPGHLTPCGLLH